jgi:hypothetical protein
MTDGRSVSQSVSPGVEQSVCCVSVWGRPLCRQCGLSVARSHLSVSTVHICIYAYFLLHSVHSQNLRLREIHPVHTACVCPRRYSGPCCKGPKLDSRQVWGSLRSLSLSLVRMHFAYCVHKFATKSNAYGILKATCIPRVGVRFVDLPVIGGGGVLQEQQF